MVTRDDFEGLEATVSYDGYDAARDVLAGAIWGGALADANAVVAVEL